jgi:hypothetical protein
LGEEKLQDQKRAIYVSHTTKAGQEKAAMLSRFSLAEKTK